MWTAWKDVWKGEALTLSQQKIKRIIKFRNIILLKLFDYNTAYMHHKTIIKRIYIYLCMYTMGKLLELVLIPIVYYKLLYVINKNMFKSYVCI